MTSKRTVVPGATIAVVIILAVAFVAPPEHEVHTAGATQLKVSVVESDIRAYPLVQASQAISDVRCRLWAKNRTAISCPDDIARTYWPTVTQAPNTMYIVWTGCISWRGAGAIINWQGYNLEYFSSNRTLVIHCYVAEPWITRHETMWGVAATPGARLLIVPTGSISPGIVQIVEDDRLEHLLGDQSTEFQLASATVS
jgi:hypothetical protein